MSKPFTSAGNAPDLSLSPETLEFLGRMLLWGPRAPEATPDDGSVLISEYLRSGASGFLDRTRYPELHEPEVPEGA